MHDELLTEFLVVFDQICVEEILVGVVFAFQLLNDRGIELIADFIEIVSLLVVTDLAHRESPAFDREAWTIATTYRCQRTVNAFDGFAPPIYRLVSMSKRENSMLRPITWLRSHHVFSSCARSADEIASNRVKVFWLRKGATGRSAGSF
jgi:hypothetical protein